nr:hypothetical protein [Streptomyces sasae]
MVEWRATPSYAAYGRAELRHETALGTVPGALAALMPGFPLQGEPGIVRLRSPREPEERFR